MNLKGKEAIYHSLVSTEVYPLPLPPPSAMTSGPAKAEKPASMTKLRSKASEDRGGCLSAWGVGRRGGGVLSCRQRAP